MTTLEQIDKDAEEMFPMNNVDHAIKRQTYRVAARYAHNKAIDKAITSLKEKFLPIEIYEILESLKIKP